MRNQFTLAGARSLAAALALALGTGPALAQDRNEDDDNETSRPTLQSPVLQNPTVQMPTQIPEQRQIDPNVIQQRPDLSRLQPLRPQGPGGSQIAIDELPRWIAETPLVRSLDVQALAVDRPRRRPLETEGMNLLPAVQFNSVEEEDEELNLTPPRLPELAREDRRVGFEFYDFRSGRSFQVIAPRAQLAGLAREMNRLVEETNPVGEPIPDEMLEQENRIEQSWSNSTDNRIRRGVADGWSDTNSIYQRMADYGGCSANILAANSRRLIAITAAHCVFTAGGGVSNSKIRPRRDGGTSPTWGSWTVYGYGYYPGFLNNDCDDDFEGVCIRDDIALVFASPDSGATPPRNMGWGYRPKGYLNDRSAYRRGYPGCSFGHSPSGCTTNTLYGDGDVFNRYFRHKDGDGWNRQFQFSSDINPGDSGSGLYYYRNGFPYVYGVTSAERRCYQNCNGRTPNFGRRITPEFFDFINSVR